MSGILLSRVRGETVSKRVKGIFESDVINSFIRGLEMLRPEALPESLLLPPPTLQQGRRQQQDMIVQLKVREGGGGR